MPLIAGRNQLLQNAATATGNGTVVDCAGYSALGLLVVGAAGLTSATVQFEGSVDDGTTWTSVQVREIDNGLAATSFAPTASSNTAFYALVAGLTQFRVRISAITPGTGSVTVRGTFVPNAGIDPGQALQPAAALGDAAANPTTSVIGAMPHLWDNAGAKWDRWWSNTAVLGTALGDNRSVSDRSSISVVGAMYGFDGSAFSRLRVPIATRGTNPDSITTAAFTTAASTTLYTPQTGKKWRLLGFCVWLSGAATEAGGGVNNVRFWDAGNATNILIPFNVPAAAYTAGAIFSSDFIWLGGGGLISSAANAVFAATLTTDLATGTFRAMLVMVEE